MGGTVSVKVREGCVWDVSESGAELTACYLARIERGTLRVLAGSMSSGLDTMAVVVRSLDLTSTAGSARLDNRQGQGRVPAASHRPPGTGHRTSAHRPDLHARAVIARQPLLRFPKPVLPGGAGPDAAYGLRTRPFGGGPGRGGVIDFAPDAALRDFGAIIGRQEPACVDPCLPPGQGRSAASPNAASPASRPKRRCRQPGRSARTRCDATGTSAGPARGCPDARVRSAGRTGAGGSRPDVANWSRSGSRVQVWFRRAIREERPSGPGPWP